GLAKVSVALFEHRLAAMRLDVPSRELAGDLGVRRRERDVAGRERERLLVRAGRGREVARRSRARRDVGDLLRARLALEVLRLERVERGLLLRRVLAIERLRRWLRGRGARRGQRPVVRGAPLGRDQSLVGVGDAREERFHLRLEAPELLAEVPVGVNDRREPKIRALDRLLVRVARDAEQIVVRDRPEPRVHVGHVRAILVREFDALVAPHGRASRRRPERDAPYFVGSPSRKGCAGACTSERQRFGAPAKRAMLAGSSWAAILAMTPSST